MCGNGFHVEGRGQEGAGRSSLGRQGFIQLPGLQEGFADFSQIHSGRQLPHCCTSNALPGSDLVWVTCAKPGKSSLLSVPLLLVFQGLFQPHSIPRKALVYETSRTLNSWAPLGSGVDQQGGCVGAFQGVWSGRHFWT